ncbi:hypothetical protein ADUPG1_004899, partial [Aduncisulcus paluster]
MSGSISLASSSQYMNKLRSSLSSSSSSSSSPSQPSSMFNANYSMSANVTDVQVPKVSRKMIRSIWRKCISEYGTLLTKFLRPCDVIPAVMHLYACIYNNINDEHRLLIRLSLETPFDDPQCPIANAISRPSVFSPDQWM